MLIKHLSEKTPMMPRLVKIDKKESPKSAPSIQETPIPPNANLRRGKSECEKTRQNTGNSTQERISGWRLKKSVEAVPRKTRRVPKRVPATHNFTYEFDPFGKLTSNSSNGITKGSRNVTNIGQGDSPSKPSNAHQNSNNLQMHMESALPKLHPRSDTILDVSLNRRENITSCGKGGNLPNISQHERNAERSVKSRDGRRKQNPTSEIDREVEKVKSDWQTFRNASGWTQGKNFANPRTRKLYDTLEKMTDEISKMQKSYLDPKSNQYLQRGAMKALNRSQISFEEKAERMKDMLFPKEGQKLVNEAMTSVSSSVIRSSMLNEIPPKNVRTNKKPKPKALLSNMPSPSNAKNASKPRGGTVLKKSANANSRKDSKKINSDIELYLDKYINEVEKKFFGKERPQVKEVDVAAEDVTEMLEKLNMNSFDIYNIPSDGEDSLLQSAEIGKSIRTNHSTRLTVDGNIIGNDRGKERREVGLSPKIGEQLMRYKGVTNFDSSIQTNTQTIPSSHAFLEMGLHALNDNFPQNSLSRVLQSEYLQKDGSLKPM